VRPAGAVAFGEDLSEPQREAVAERFGSAAAPLPIESVSRAELLASLQAAGVSPDGSERAISSALVTCEPQGSGVHVHTDNITDIPAATYANALVTAGIADAAVIVAAPPATPMTGETALVGVLRAYPHCHGGEAIPANRLRLAYDQLRLTRALAQATNDWDRAAAAVLRATQQAITAARPEPASMEPILDEALVAEGLAAPTGWRAAAGTMLAELGAVERGSYGRGYTLQQLGRDDVWVRANP
jgi:uncharacterized protein YpuA (DUF1002 family)